MKTDVCVIGAGPAGLMSAIFAAQAGAQVVVIEKNAAAGQKLLLTGGGRCNITHTGTVDDFVRAYGKSGRFLRHCLHEFSPDATRDFFGRLGVETKVDEDGCVFPVSESASNVQYALLGQCQKLRVQFISGRGVDRIEKRGGGFAVFAGSEIASAPKVIIAAGGASYPATGSSGDGYKLAKSLGHTIVEPKPALVPLVTTEKWCAELAGISRDNVTISVMIDKKRISVNGPMIFTYDGIGGPAVLDLSRLLTDYLPAKKPIEVTIDLVPAMNEAKLEEYLINQLSQYSKKNIANVLFELAPKKLGGLICDLAGITETTASQLKKEQRRKVIQLLKKLPVPIIAARSIEEATITNGGVSTAGIDPTTMQSKVCPGLYFAGEVIDVDGPCGGYNLQIAWSSGVLAGQSAIAKF
ncbi:MAG: NAD(P)/FAD-dependent oxidoreductase [Sedimentisphaerales bacterium]|jgi:predicted Rossmann fold flavoprotein